MGTSKNINSYYDVREVLDTALAHGKPTQYRLHSPGAARHWMQRAYSFRKLAFEIESEKFATIPGYVPETPYDRIVLRLEPGSDTVTIKMRKVEGTILDSAGRPITPVQRKKELDDAAAQAIRDLDLDFGDD